MGDGLVKIGTTTNLRQRMAALRRPATALLAWERGSYDREAELHRRFTDLAVGHEQFRAGEHLLRYILALNGD